MSGNEETIADRPPQLEDALAEYERTPDIDRSLKRTELLARLPDVAGELALYFANRDSIEQITAPLRFAVNGPDRIGDFGDYRIAEEIALGGMAVVYKAHQTSLDRPVALKFILAGRYATAEDRAGFRDDAQFLARLRHTNIVEIHECGEHDGWPYLSLEFMGGRSLAAQIADGVQRSNRESAQLLQTLARAVHYAHENGIIHRDLKPANVLFTGAGDEGVAKIADFGLAKRLDELRQTPEGAIAGTPSFMAPEQIDTTLGSIGPATDVWALGVILYQLLTDRSPFQSATQMATFQRVLNLDPVAPRRLNRKVDRDLEAICLKCLKKERNRRYVSAKALAEDLQAYLDGKPLPHAGVWERTVKWIRRRPTLAASLACCVVLAVMAIGLVHHVHVKEREDAVEDALDALRDCRLVEAGQANDRAERLCGMTGQVRSFHGWLALARGRPRQAIRHLKTARTDLPHSVATLAMLAVAYNHAGQLGEYQRTLAELKRLSPITPDDYLWTAQAESFADPMRGLQTAAVAIGLHDSIFGRLIRAEIRTRCATLHGDAALAKSACDDAFTAKQMSRNTPVTLSASIQAHLVAARLLEGTDLHQRHLDDASADVEALANCALPIAAIARWLYFDYRKEQDPGFKKAEAAAFEALGRVSEHDRNPWIAQLYALGLYRRGKFKEALDALEGIERRGEGTVFFALARAHILAKQSDNGPARARKALNDVEDPNGLLGVFLSPTLSLLGQEARAVDDETVPSWRNGWYRQLLKYNRGDLTGEALERLAGTSKWNQCEAHYFIAMNLLAEGKRNEAAEHFGKSVNTHVVHYFAYQWSRAFLVRIQDPNWPRR